MISVGTANCTIDNLFILPTWYVCFVHLSQRMSIISVISIKKLDFVTDTGFVLCEAETELMLCIMNVSLERVSTVICCCTLHVILN